MMKLLVWGVILSLNLSFVNASAAAGSSGDGGLADFEKVAGNDDSRFRLLAQSICETFSSAGVNFKKTFNRRMRAHMGKFENNPNPSPKQITDYLNKHKDKMTCGTGKNKKNYMLVAFDEGAESYCLGKYFKEII